MAPHGGKYCGLADICFLPFVLPRRPVASEHALNHFSFTIILYSTASKSRRKRFLEMNAPYEPKAAANGTWPYRYEKVEFKDTWFDPTGETKYDRVVIQLHNASHEKQHVVAQLEGGGCGACSIVPFREPSDPMQPTHYGMSGLVACERDDSNDKVLTLRFTVGPNELKIGDEDKDKVLEEVGADGWACVCPVPAKGAGWVKGWVTADGWVEQTRSNPPPQALGPRPHLYPNPLTPWPSPNPTVALTLSLTLTLTLTPWPSPNPTVSLRPLTLTLNLTLNLTRWSRRPA